MGLSATDKALVERIENDFTYHAPQGTQPALYERMRAHGKALALLIVEACPDGRERSTALSKLEECVMWANAAIARRPDDGGQSG